LRIVTVQVQVCVSVWACRHVPRRDGVTSDAVLRPLARQVLGELVHGAFGGGVERAGADGHHAGDGRVEHDARGARRLEQRVHELAHVVRRLDVGREDELELLSGIIITSMGEAEGAGR
jgi:hypothetical protein